jgi:hypothetical protein
MMGWRDVLNPQNTAIVLPNNTYDEAQGKPLPSLVDSSAEVATILRIRQSLIMFVVLTLLHT